MISTGWADVEAAIVADYTAGFSVPEIAARCGWGTDLVGTVLRRHGIVPRGRSWGKHRDAWTGEETATIRPARDAGEARRLHRAAYPGSTRTDTAIDAEYRRERRAGRTAVRA